MAERGAIVARPIWVKQAEEARLKDEEQKAAAARAAFDATFKDVSKFGNKEVDLSDSENDETDGVATKPIGPIDPSKCVAAGTGIGGGAACTAVSFVVVTKDSDGTKMHHGGAQIRVKIKPDPGVGGSEQDAVVKDNGDGTYAVTYVVGKRGNYMVHVDCNGRPIMGSPFPVFFSTGSLVNVSLFNASGNTLNSSFPNQSMPNYPVTTSGLFSGMLGMISGILPSASGGAVLPGLGASFGEVCRVYLNGRCERNDCKFNHPPYNQLIAALAAGSTMGGLSQMPMAPSAAAMAAAQTIVAAQALQAHAAQAQAQAQAQSAAESTGGSPSQKGQDYGDVISRTVEVSNLGPLLTSEQLRELFRYCGTVTHCEIVDSKQLAYVEYSKPEEARAALALNKMEVSGRALDVEMAKSLHLKKPTLVAVTTTNSVQHPPLPLMMQQAVAMQQLQFQQALVMQQSMASQQAASRAASMKSATEMASARAAEISKRLKVDGDGIDDKTTNPKSSSPIRSCAKSRSRSRSPIRYRRDQHSRSRSPMIGYQRDRHSRLPLRPHHRDRNISSEQNYHYRGGRDNYQKYHGRQEWGRPRNPFSGNVWSRSQSKTQMLPRTRSISPRYYKEKKSSPKLPKEEHKSAHRSRLSRSLSKEPRQYVKENEDISKQLRLYSRKPETEVKMCMAKPTDLHQDLVVREDKLIKDLIKSESCKKTLTKPEEGMREDNAKYRAGRKKSRLEDNDNCTNNARVCTKSDDMLKYRKSAYDSEEDTKEKKRHTNGSMMDDDGDMTKRKLHGKEKRYVDVSELDEKKLQKREKKAPDDNEVSKIKKHQRKGNEIEPELHDASKQYKKHNKNEEVENRNKKMRTNQHSQTAASDSSEDSLLEDGMEMTCVLKTALQEESIEKDGEGDKIEGDEIHVEEDEYTNLEDPKWSRQLVDANAQHNSSRRVVEGGSV
ncbi:hypothetical protein KI387_020007 [Taxus chinensis]|uniref:Uncharacterized protein n=1 Tax=Taxus chinensis TaxID=29808 RepID=A0AA38GAD3_TAXCH|nr:hypothetical protein KI387_020007 [Taxus chinensis]